MCRNSPSLWVNCSIGVCLGCCVVKIHSEIISIDQGSCISSLVAHCFLVSLFSPFLYFAFIPPLLSSWPPTNRTLFCSSTLCNFLRFHMHCVLSWALSPSCCCCPSQHYNPCDDYMKPFYFTVNPPANLHVYPAPTFPNLLPISNQNPLITPCFTTARPLQSSSLRGLRWRTSATRL